MMLLFVFFLVYYYYNYGFSTVFLFMFIYTASFIMGNWFAHSEAYGKVRLDFDDMAVEHFYLFVILFLNF